MVPASLLQPATLTISLLLAQVETSAKTVSLLMQPLEIIPLNSLATYLRRLVEGKLWLKVLFAMLAGMVAGALLHPATGLVPETVSQGLGEWLALPGNLFLKLVQMIMIPLIFSSIISGIVSNSSEQLQQMGVRLLLYFIATTTLSITLATVLSLIFQPGATMYEKRAFVGPETSPHSTATQEPAFQNIPEAISNLIPENPLASMLSGEMLSIVIFTIIVGIAIIQLSPDTVRPMLQLLHAIQEICMTVVSWAMRLVPYAVFGLIAQLASSIGIEGLAGIAYYIGVVLLGLALLLGCYMVILLVFGQTSPITFMRDIREVQLLAFSTTSSAAVMPLSMKTADEKLGVSSKISDFVIPVGATINMDGTALYQGISALFIAQAYGIELSMSQLILMMITLVAASIGTPAIPGGGVVILATVLQSVGIPAQGLMIIIGVDRILGMFRTAVNVTGDLTACVVFDRWQKREGEPTNQRGGGRLPEAA